MDINNKTYLQDLIKKLDDGSISNEELQLLSNFFVNHQGNKKFPFEAEHKAQVKEELYAKIAHKISQGKKTPTQVIPFYKAKLFRYVAAASVLALIASSIYFKNKPVIEELPVVEASQIKSGTDKAILTLEDGSVVTLEKGQAYANESMTSNGEELIYNKSNHKTIAYNSLTIPRGGQYMIKLTDGTKVWLNSESKLKYPVNFIKGQSREVELVYGEAYFEVSPSTQHNGSKFLVTSNTQKVEVLGTQFNVKAYLDDDTSYTTLVEGSVKIENSASSKILKPGEQALILNTGKEIIINNVDVDRETAWKRGLFVFNKQSLEEMMKTLSRWYDVEVIYNDDSKKKEIFSGMLKRRENIESLLRHLEGTGDVKFTIDKKTIYVK